MLFVLVHGSDANISVVLVFISILNIVCNIALRYAWTTLTNCLYLLFYKEGVAEPGRIREEGIQAHSAKKTGQNGEFGPHPFQLLWAFLPFVMSKACI